MSKPELEQFTLKRYFPWLLKFYKYLSKIEQFFRTFVLLLRGRRLWLLEKEKRANFGLLSPWAYNIFQTSGSTFLAVQIAPLIAYLHGVSTPAEGWNQVSSYFHAALAPFTLAIYCFSVEMCSDVGSGSSRDSSAYLYIEASIGIVWETIVGSYIVIMYVGSELNNEFLFLRGGFTALFIVIGLNALIYQLIIPILIFRSSHNNCTLRFTLLYLARYQFWTLIFAASVSSSLIYAVSTLDKYVSTLDLIVSLYER